jgi:hypothetical protein
MAKLGQTWHRWTIDEEEYVRKNYKTMSYSEMAKVLNMTKDMVKGMGRKLGLINTKFSDEKKKRIAKAAADNIRLHNYTKKSAYLVQKKRCINAFKNIMKEHPDMVNDILNEINYTNELRQ